MSERFTKLFSLRENLYVKGAPVVIAAGVLHKDNQADRIIAQIKIRSISSKKIKATKVSIKPFDVTGNSLGDAVYHQYLDLDVQRDVEFGQKEPIALPNVTTRSFSISVDEVIFYDNSIWHCEDDAWEPLPKPASLSSLHDLELTKQFRIEYGNDSENLPLDEKDIWFCSCGKINHQEEENCYSCGNSHVSLQNLNIENMQARKAERLQAEQVKKQEELEEKKQKANALKKRNKKIASIAIPVIAICIGAVVVISTVLVPKSKYKKANTLIENENYVEAISVLTEIPKYPNSDILLKYCEAHLLFNEGHFLEAKDMFEQINSNKDCNDLINECSYQIACEAYNAGEFDTAKTAFEALAGYKDSQDMILQCEYGKAREQEKTSIKKAYETYKKLPADFLDVKNRMDLISALIEWEGEYKAKSYILMSDSKYFEHTLTIAFSIEDDDVYLKGLHTDFYPDYEFKNDKLSELSAEEVAKGYLYKGLFNIKTAKSSRTYTLYFKNDGSIDQYCKWKPDQVIYDYTFYKVN